MLGQKWRTPGESYLWVVVEVEVIKVQHNIGRIGRIHNISLHRYAIEIPCGDVCDTWWGISRTGPGESAQVRDDHDVRSWIWYLRNTFSKGVFIY